MKTQLYAVFQKPTLTIRTQIIEMLNDGKRYTKLLLIKRVAKLISEKVGFKAKNIPGQG